MAMADKDGAIRSTCPPLRVERVSRSFGGLQAVNDISFEVHAGERLAILGPNGAGKSTLFNLVCGDLSADAGRVFLQGEDVTHLALHHRVRRGLARTYQTSSAFEGLTVVEHLILAMRGPRAGRLSVWARKAQRGLAAEAVVLAQRVGLGDRVLDEASILSHGQLRQLEVGMALAANPIIVLLDEPAAGLSADERQRLISLLSGLDDSVAVVLVEHDMDVALTVADRVLVLESGRLVVEGTPAQIEADPVVQAIYLGEQHGSMADQHQARDRRTG